MSDAALWILAAYLSVGAVFGLWAGVRAANLDAAMHIAGPWLLEWCMTVAGAVVVVAFVWPAILVQDIRELAYRRRCRRETRP